DLRRTGSAHQVDGDPVRLDGVPCPVHGATAGGDLCLELDEVLVEMSEHVVLDRCAGCTKLRPVGQLVHDLRPLGLDRGGRRTDVATQLSVAHRFSRSGWERSSTAQLADSGRRPWQVGAHHGTSSVAARISAKCMVRTPVFSRDSPPPMCIRHEASFAVQISAAVSRTALILSASIAVETSGFFSAKVPPKPQHDCASGSGTRSIPRTARSSRSGRSPTLSARNPWHAGWYVTRCGK